MDPHVSRLVVPVTLRDFAQTSYSKSESMNVLNISLWPIFSYLHLLSMFLRAIMKCVHTYVALHEFAYDKTHRDAWIAGGMQQAVLACPPTIPTEQDHNTSFSSGNSSSKVI